MYRLLVCGSRDYNNPQEIERVLSGLKNSVSVVIHGGARGADFMAGTIAKKLGLPVEVYPADWNTHGKAAGLIRNKQMLDEAKPTLWIAFVNKPLHESRGTAHMVRLLQQAQIEGHVFWS